MVAAACRRLRAVSNKTTTGNKANTDSNCSCITCKLLPVESRDGNSMERGMRKTMACFSPVVAGSYAAELEIIWRL